MNRSLPFLFATLLAFSTAALGADGLIAIKSPFAAKEAMNRFEENAKERGLNIFARIDHSAGAAKIGKTLRPTEVLIFGNPQGGTRLWNVLNRSVSIVRSRHSYGRRQGQVWLGYNDPAFLAQRHCVALRTLAEATIAH